MRADFDGNNHDDLYVVLPGRKDVILFLDDQDNILKEFTVPYSSNSTAVSVLDFDGDGAMDFFLGTGDGTASVLFKNMRTSAGMVFKAYGLYMINDRIDDCTLTDCDGDGKEDIVLTGAMGVILLHNQYPR